MTVPGQLAFELTVDKVEDMLDDLDFAGHEARLLVLDGVDYLPPSTPTCSCAPHPLVVHDELYAARCILCGRPA